MSEDLDELRWHWGDAYLIEHFPGPGKWVAQRRDDHATISASTPDELNDKIRADYLKCPVSRCIFRQGLSGGTRGTRFRPEG